jgi:FMN reductase
MPHIVAIAGSPSVSSKASTLLGLARTRCEEAGVALDAIIVRELDAGALINGRADSPTLQPHIERVCSACAVMVISPVYKATYTGVLKVFLDLLPPNALAEIPVLPVMMGGSAMHTLAVDYGLKPLLAVLGARSFARSVYLMDAQFVGGVLDEAGRQSYFNAVDELIAMRRNAALHGAAD